MKKVIAALALVAALSGCEEATKAIDQAQEAANNAVDSLQEQVAGIDLGGIKLDEFGSVATSVEEFTSTIEELASGELDSPQALIDAQQRIVNAYSCFVDATSEATAESVVNTVIESLDGTQLQSVLEEGVAKAKDAQACITGE